MTSDLRLSDGGIRRLGLDPSYAAEGFEQLAADSMCSICHSYLEDIVETNCPARHIFCRPCFENVWNRNKPCPECRGRFTKMETAHNRIRSFISGVEWKCVNFQDGCSFKGTKREMERHLDRDCQQQETQCPFKGCREKVRRCLLLEHTLVCPFHPIPCDFCQEDILVTAMVKHLSECNHVPVPCPNGCGQNPPRGEISFHMETQCDKGVVSCEVPGCGTQVKRKDMGGHEEGNMRKHVKLLTARSLVDELRQKVFLPEYEQKAAQMKKGEPMRSLPFSFQGSRFAVVVYSHGPSHVPEGRDASLFLSKVDDYFGEVSYSIQAGGTTLGAERADFSRCTPLSGRGSLAFCSSESLLAAARNSEHGSLEVEVSLSAPSSTCQPVVTREYDDRPVGREGAQGTS